MASKIKVCAVFDDTKSLTKRTHFLLPAEGTIGDAESIFQTKHAPTLWQTPNVELVGILEQKDLELPYGQATPSLTHSDFKLQEMMAPSDLLVFRAVATTQQEQAEQTPVKEEEPESVKEEEPESVREEKPESATRAEKTGSTANTRRNARESTLTGELKRIADYLKPPRTWTNSRKKAKLDDYSVGSQYYCLRDDGIEYPVRIIHSGWLTIEENERLVEFCHGCGKKGGVFATKTDKLLPATAEREARFLNAYEKKREQRREESEKRLEEQYGPATSVEALPQCTYAAGSLIVQHTTRMNRRVYISRNNDTPLSVAKMYGIAAEKIVYDNRQLYPTLQKTSRLFPNTCIVLPPHSPS